MIDWDSIKDGQIEIGYFGKNEYGLLNYRILINSIGVEIPVHELFMKSKIDFIYYINVWNNEAVNLTKEEINNEFFKTLKKRVFCLYPELLL